MIDFYYDEGVNQDSKYSWLTQQLQAFSGNISLYLKELKTGETYTYREKAPHVAASIIKLFLMAAIFQGFEDGDFLPSDRLAVPRSECVPSCGVLTYLDNGKVLSLRDLTELMIIVSDNTAANLLYDFYGSDRLNTFIHKTLGFSATVYQRKMFDEEKAAKGIQNYTTAADTAALLERIYNGRLISPRASRQMLTILEHQRLNNKIPARLKQLSPAPVIAHKTGEDKGITHDVGIIEGNNPLLLCFLADDVDTFSFEREIADLSWLLYSV